MAIDATQRKQMAGGLVLVATYKKEEYRATVVETEGKLRFQLADGREFGSPSAAGSAVMGGTACNGWRFWSVEIPQRAAEAMPAKAPGRPKGRAKATTS